MASSRITLSVDKEHYRAARKAAQKMDTTVSRLTDLFFQTLAVPEAKSGKGKLSALRGAFLASGKDERHALVSQLKAKHLR